MGQLCNIIIGVITGLISSFLVWWFLFHFLVPKIKFSEKISKTKENGKPTYKFKFENSGRRKLIDLQINIRFRVKGLENDPNWKVVSIPFSKDKNEQIPFLSSAKDTNAIRELRPLLITDAQFNQDNFPPEIVEKFGNQTLSLEDLFELGTEQRLQINIFCYDEFSGTRKLFSSKNYKRDDILEGKFDKNSLNIITG